MILGPSGDGKTTCLNILGGMDSATNGKVIIGENDITNYSSKELITYRRKDIGFVFQFYNLIQNLTAIENVELAVQLNKNHLDPKRVLEQVGLKDRIHNYQEESNKEWPLRVQLLKIPNYSCVMNQREP